jgi:hypothetical protein
VSTSAARYQQLSLNPAKLAGQCGKLKCCLNYELDQYVEALREFPSVNTRLRLPKGDAVHFKTDIFKQVMFFIYEGQPGEAPFPLHTSAVKEIIEQNRKGIAIEDLDEFLEEEEVEVSTDFAQVVGQDSLTRFDRKRSGGKSGKRKPTRGKGPDRRDRVEAKQPQGKTGNNPSAPSQGGDKRNPQERPQGGNARPERGNRPDRQRNDKGPSNDRPQRQQNRPQGDNKAGGEQKPKELKGPQSKPNQEGRPNQEGKPVDKNRGNRNNRHRNPNNKGKQEGNSNAPKTDQP